MQSSGKYEEEDENRPTATEELAGYLWDNYIELVGRNYQKAAGD